VKSDPAAPGETVLSVEERIRGLVPDPDEANLPTVVWLCEPSELRVVVKINLSTFNSELHVIPLRRFHCYRVDLESLPEGDLRTAYLENAPAFYFFDPAGELVKKVERKRATSQNVFRIMTEQTWTRSFTMEIRAFLKRTTAILDRLVIPPADHGGMDSTLKELETSPDPARAAAVGKKMAKLTESRREIEKEEQALRASCTLRPEYLPARSNPEEERE
jgi:hypothetical protein